VKRALLLALVAAAVSIAAGPVTPPSSPIVHGGAPPERSGSVIGEGLPLKAYATITPSVHLFGDVLTAKLAVVADTKWVKPADLHVVTRFLPYRPIQLPKVIRLQSGRFEQITYTWKLRCLDYSCVPKTPPNDKYHVFHFSPAKIRYASAYTFDAYWPPVEVISQISPGLAAFIETTNHIKWQTAIAPVAKPTYHLRPTALFWLALALAMVLGAVAVVSTGRWYLAVRPRRTSFDQLPGTPLERALAVLRYAHETGDETLQRKAFERVAGELGAERADELTNVARELAWSPRTPEDEEIEQFAVQALEEQE
jgi:hypothetical protein